MRRLSIGLHRSKASTRCAHSFFLLTKQQGLAAPAVSRMLARPRYRYYQRYRIFPDAAALASRLVSLCCRDCLRKNLHRADTALRHREDRAYRAVGQRRPTRTVSRNLRPNAARAASPTSSAKCLLKMNEQFLSKRSKREPTAWVMAEPRRSLL